MNATLMTELITATWARALKRTSIGPEENFFQIGGTPSSAAEIVSEINQAYGRTLPETIVYTAPTIASQVEMLQRSSSPVTSPPLLLLRPGRQHPPIFLAHGMGGSAMQFFHLLRHISVASPMYGMQERGIDGTVDPVERVEDMAEYSLSAMRQVQPSGPYLLIGYSFGGLIVLEIARRILEDGQRVALLVMLDSYPHRRQLSKGQYVRLMYRLAKTRLSSNRKHPARSSSASSTRTNAAAERVHEAEKRAWRSYQRTFYPGKVNFVRAETNLWFPDNPAAVWSRFVGQFELQRVPGGHITMLSEHSEKLGSVLSRLMMDALADAA